MAGYYNFTSPSFHFITMNDTVIVRIWNKCNYFMKQMGRFHQIYFKILSIVLFQIRPVVQRLGLCLVPDGIKLRYDII